MKRFFVCFLTGVLSVFAAPLEYYYHKNLQVGNTDGLQSAVSNGLPCVHAAANLIQSQSIGRIVNNQRYQHHTEETATGGVNYQQPQTHNPNSFIPNPNDFKYTHGSHNTISNNNQIHNHNTISANVIDKGSPEQYLPPPPIYQSSLVHGADPAKQNPDTYTGSFSQNSYSTQSNYAGAQLNSFSASRPGGYTPLSSAAPLESTNSAPCSTSHFLSTQLGEVVRQTFANAPLDPTFEKHIYVHAPPGELEDHSKNSYAQLPVQQLRPRKHYKIIFIKAPSGSASAAHLSAAAAPQIEEKTLIYVLVKKPDELSAEDIQHAQQSAVQSSKPEVYFIKYKTRNDAESQGSAYASGTQYSSESQLSGAAGPFPNVADTGIGGSQSENALSLYSPPHTSSISSTTLSPLYGVPIE